MQATLPAAARRTTKQNYVEVRDASALCRLVIRAGLSTHDSSSRDSVRDTSPNTVYRASYSKQVKPRSYGTDASRPPAGAATLKESNSVVQVGTVVECREDEAIVGSSSASWRWYAGRNVGPGLLLPPSKLLEERRALRKNAAANASIYARPAFIGVTSRTWLRTTTKACPGGAQDTRGKNDRERL